jgi:hypothetical protein
MYSRSYATGEYTTTVSEQRLGKHVPAETNSKVRILRFPLPIITPISPSS